jgi:hypothetical protein
MEKNNPEIDISIPNIQDYYIKNGLYAKYKIENKVGNKVFEILFTQNSIDCFCLECNSDSVFTAQENFLTRNALPGHNIHRPITSFSEWGVDLLKISNIFSKNFTCSRNNNHILYFETLILAGFMQKIGQFPSSADLNVSKIKQFKRVLGKDFFKEYSTSLGLFAHGVGVGSFVYLRRIVENFILKPAIEEAKKVPSFDEKIFLKERYKERIQILKPFLPQYLIENPNLYSVISKGIHEINEEECLKYFPIVSSILDFILTEMKDKIELEERKKAMQSELAKITGQISN